MATFKKRIIDTPVQYLKGVGPKLAQVFKRLGVFTIRDLLYYFPRAYDDRRIIPSISNLQIGQVQFVKAKVLMTKEEITWQRKSIFKTALGDGSGIIWGIWFNQPFLKKVIKKDQWLFVKGKVEYNMYTKELQLLGQEYEILPDLAPDSLSVGRVVPMYPLTENLYQRKVRSLVFQTLQQYLPTLTDPLPDYLRYQYNLIHLPLAISNFHFPSDRLNFKKARRRLVFDEFFFLQLGLAKRKEKFSQQMPGIVFQVEGPLITAFKNSLPFKLTPSQEAVIEEIKLDMVANRPMNRLLQGDVGSGKTIVAAFSILFALQTEYQASFMAPTEILAEQHYTELKKWLVPLGINVQLLIGSLKVKEKRKVQEIIKSNWPLVVVGTQALIEEKVKFGNLGLVIIDEQHRFGVLQRAALKQKGYNPDLLVMTATPIPRTLALTCYGDLDKSVIDQLPPGRQKVTTYFIPGDERQKVYQMIREEIRKGRQAYIVYPLVEETEKLEIKAATQMAEELQEKEFSNWHVGLLHGQLKTEEKEKVMTAFRQGEIEVLVTTTVIEVGVDVPRATIIAVEEAERFGLSQLHQLRGRVGRGREKSFCFLIGSPKTNESQERLSALVNLSDGFEIAEVDLKIRGPGEFYGTRQSGLPEFKVADLIRDEKILHQARLLAFQLISEDPNLVQPEFRYLKEEVIKRFGEFLEIGSLD